MEKAYKCKYSKPSSYNMPQPLVDVWGGGPGNEVILEKDNAIVFTDEDMEVPYSDHRRPLYLEGEINDVFIRRDLVDIGSSVNILPLSVLMAAGIPLFEIVQSQTSISGFGNKSEVTVGHMQVNLKVGPIRSLTKFYVVDVDVAYHALLGRPWLNKHKLVVWGLNCILWESPEYGEEVMQTNSHNGPNHKAPMPCAFQEPETAPKHMQDGSTAVAEKLETINLSDDSSTQRPIFISIHLTSEEKETLKSLLKEFRDVFARSY
ncbi:unnamed protein product [Prunus armeniaca]